MFNRKSTALGIQAKLYSNSTSAIYWVTLGKLLNFLKLYLHLCAVEIIYHYEVRRFETPDTEMQSGAYHCNCTLKNSNQNIINDSTKGIWLVKSVGSKNAETTSTCKQEGRSCKYVYKYTSWWRMHFMAMVNYLWWFKNKVNKNWEKEDEVDKHSLMSIRFFFDFFLKKLLFYIALKHWS